MNDIDKIAAEARRKIRAYFNKPLPAPDSYESDDLIIIKSAIERAHKVWRGAATKEQISQPRTDALRRSDQDTATNDDA